MHVLLLEIGLFDNGRSATVDDSDSDSPCVFKTFPFHSEPTAGSFSFKFATNPRRWWSSDTQQSTISSSAAAAAATTAAAAAATTTAAPAAAVATAAAAATAESAGRDATGHGSTTRATD